MGKPKHQKAHRVVTDAAKEAGYRASDRKMTPEGLQQHLLFARRQRTFGTAKHAGRNTRSGSAWKREGSIAA